MELSCLPQLGNSLRSLARWHALKPGWIKANINATIGPNGVIGVKAVLWDDGENIVAVLMANFQELSNAFYDEVKVISKCLELIRTMKLFSIIFETDSSEAIKTILALCTSESESALVIRRIQGNLHTLSSWKLQHVYQGLINWLTTWQGRCS